MAEFIALLQEIQQLPSGVHIFCPRQDDDDLDRYDNETQTADGGDENAERQKKITEAKQRREKFVSAFQLLAYDGEESEQYQRYIWETLDNAMSRCDICIREYYIAKIDLQVKLREEYEEEDINSFFNLINRQDISRIKRGLDAATATLQNLPEQKRGTGALDPRHLHAVFEALICESFLQNEELVRTHFDEPFRLLQTRKPLKMREIMPATTRFLLDSNSRRVEWASMIWSRIDHPPSELEWNWAIKDHLQYKLQHISDAADIARFWSGLRLIVKSLDERQITHKLFDIVPNVAFTALDHLAKRTQAVPFITQTIHTILDKAPAACWHAWGSISSQTVIEQIFASPNFNKFLFESATAEKAVDVDVVGWIPAFLDSLKPANRPSACRVLVNQLFPRIDDTNNPLEVRRLCFETVVKVILQTILAFSNNEQNRKGVARLVLSDTLDIISQRIQPLLSPTDPKLAEVIPEATKDEIYSIIRNSLNLECQCLKADFETLTEQETLEREAMSFSPNIWETILKLMHQDNVKLSSQVLLGVMPLPGLEQFRATSFKPLSKDRSRYNSVFEKLNDMVSKILERLSEFRPSHLDQLFKCQETCFFLVAALFSADQNIYQTGIDLVKNISGVSGRKEALAHLIDAFFTTTIYSICWTFRRISNMQTFSSVPRMLKTGLELLDVLCNPSTGKLRSRKLDSGGFGAVQSFWSYQWIALRTIFKQTEQWSLQVYDKPLMTEVCRDAMQYAESLFEQYDLFASVIGNTRSGLADDVSKILLNADDPKVGSPLKTLDVMSKWLRLRDEYLADTLVKLIVKLLYRLKRHDASTDVQGLNYIVEVAVKSSIKTILSAAQKAMLIRALESFTGKTYDRPVQKKQSTLRTWTESVVDGRSGTSTPVSVDDNYDEYGDSEIADDDLTEITSIGSKQEPSVLPKREKPKSTISALPHKPRPTAVSIQQTAARKQLESKAFIENRKREREAALQRQKEAALKLRGQYGMGDVTKGQGSGVSGLGVKGKDHSAPASELMVSSDSDSDSDSDDGLFGKSRTLHHHGPGQMPTVRKAVPAGPVKKIKQIRSQKDIRARLAPDLSTLHQTILGWDFFAETDLPPNAEKDNYSLVTKTFTTPTDYQKTFGPLLVLESWQSFRSAREDGSFKPFELKISNSLLVDNFFEVNCVMPHSAYRDLGLNVADVVLFSRATIPHNSPKEPHCLARVKEVTRKRGEVQVAFRLNASNNALRSSLTDNSTIFGVVVLSLTPLEREYGALMALPFYDLCDEIITAKPSPLLNYSENELSPLRKVYSVNTAQAKAIKSAMDNDAFTLIQGPPGSGKTKTICAIVGAMLTGHTSKVSTLSKTGNNANGPTSSSTKKLLVCAPSNAAVDELVMRFREGIVLSSGQKEKISIVRLGRSEIINSKVKDVTLEELVNQRLNTSIPKLPQEDIHAVMMEHKSASDELISVRDRISDLRNKGQSVSAEDEQLIDNLKRKKAVLGTKIDDLREKQNTATRDAELNRRRVQQEVLDGAHVLCATLSGSGHEIFHGLNVEFETVIIDEAAQSIELSALIPLKYGCSKCILVGDPKQLPPTVLSREAAKFQYEQSLFARMEKNHRKDVHLLDTQYRMHPDISIFPSKTFYDSRLKDGPDMAKLRSRVWHKSTLFAPYRFFDVQGMSESQTKGHSLINVAELEVAMQMYHRLTTDVKNYDFSGKIGIITPYKGQLKELKLRFKQRYGEEILSRIDFNTTDAFQGRESEIIIFSCVRASTKGIGFLNDIRRMNVGLTRAKCSLWVLGNSQSLVQGEFWRALVSDAKSRNVYTEGNILSMLKRPQLTPDMIKADIEMTDAIDNASLKSDGSDSLSGQPHQKNEKLSLDTKLHSSHSSADEGSAVSSRASSAGAIKSRTSTPASATNARGLPTRVDSFSSSASHHDTTSSSRRYVGPLNGNDPNFTDGKFTDIQIHAYGPAGGKNGLNDKMNCNICGSSQHQTQYCDNDLAKTAARGNCDRCHEPGHFASNCREVRCLECGEFGHESAGCRVPTNKRLNREEKQDIERQEARFERMRIRAKEKRLEKGSEDHRPSIPTVKTSATIPPKRGGEHSSRPLSGNDEHKRKRQDSLPDTGKRPKVLINNDNRSSSRLMNNGTSGLPAIPHIPRHSHQNKDSVAGNSKIDSKAISTTNDQRDQPRAKEPAPPSEHKPTYSAATSSTMPPMKKKKKRDADLFVKKK